MSSVSSFNWKSGASQQISNYTLVGSGTVNQYSNNPTSFSWTGGTPTGSATTTTTGLWVASSGNGFQISVPADTTERTLKLYVGVWSAKGKLDARLSDNSSAAYTDMSLDNSSNTSNGVYTLVYKAGSAGQTLTVKYTVETAYDASFGNVTLQAAALSGSGTASPTATPTSTPTATPTSTPTATPTSTSVSGTGGTLSGTVGASVGQEINDQPKCSRLGALGPGKQHHRV